ncbi:MAG TPA: hypothetical protein VNQ90_05230 [Chthoniobacteraceae bacterium]|nr:hypothetical protein [Chthoniobacteraceae bacterium]
MNQYPEHAGNLKNTPFQNLSELNDAILNGFAKISIDTNIALKWVQGGIYLPSKTRTQALLYMLLPYATIAGFIIYTIATSSWLLLLTLPILIFSFLLSHPRSTKAFGSTKNWLIGLIVFGLGLGLSEKIDWLFAFLLTFTLIWYGLHSLYRTAINGLIQAALEHEDLFYLLWNRRVLGIQLNNGHHYWSD